MPMWVRDIETNGFLAVNDATIRLYGYTREEFRTMTAFDLRAPEHHAQYREFLARRRPSETTVTRWRHRRKDGTPIDVEVTARGFVYQGKAARLGVIKDITEQVRAERALHESEQRYRDLFDLNPSPMWVYDRNTFAFVAVNECAARQYGYTKAEFSRMTLVDLWPEDDVRRNLENLRRRDPASVLTHQARHRRKDGAVIDVELLASPLADPARPLRIVLATDITARKRMENAVRESEERLRAAFDQAAVGMTLRNADPADPGWVRFNQKLCDIVGYTREELSGMNFLDLTPPEDLPTAIEYNRRLLSGELESYTRERRYVRKDGTLIWVSVSVSAVRAPDGTPRQFLAVIQDITERIRAEEEIRRLNAELEERVRERTRRLEAANRELESFSYSVSHDLRAPLRSIEGFSKALQEDYEAKLGAEGKDFLRRVRSATQRMAGLIDDLLTLSRMSRAEMRSDSVDLSALSDEIAEELRRHEPQRTVSVVVQPGMQARGDPSLVRVVLQNLLHNAWKFSGRRRDARIEVGTIERNGRQVFFVRDNGVGFDMAYADRLFGAFQRLHGEADFPGTGIGLATVQRIVRRHGGEVWAEAAPEQGATLFFTLAPEPAILNS